MQERMFCPVCKKRLLDLEVVGMVCITIKCSHCKNVVTISQRK